MTATQYLQRAHETMIERGQTYDSEAKDGAQERSMAKCVQAFNAITGQEITESQGWMFMALLKLVRQHSGGYRHADSALDLVAYAALFAESLEVKDV